MSTLTQILLAALLNYLGITGEVPENKISDKTEILTEVSITCEDTFMYCPYSEENLCNSSR